MTNNPYIESLLSRKVVLKITDIGKNVKDNLEKRIQHTVEGKCVDEGFIKPKTVEIISYSSGLIKDDHVEFQVVFKCMVCYPVKDIEMDCTVHNVTKAGIHAQVVDEADNVPITIFVARDHHQANPEFEKVVEKDTIRVRIIGVRFELNDPSITAIASLVEKSM
jgi:DNA-directed RNA polymerase subunit E'/Rpb7